MDGRTLILSALGSPKELLDKAGVVFLALDRFSKNHMKPECLERARHLAVSVFEESADELLRLLDEGEGPRALARLLGKEPTRKPDRDLETEIRNVLRRTKTELLVHFESGGGHLARGLAARLSSLKVITLDSSPARRERADSRLGLIGEARLGSLSELHAPLPMDSTALVVDSLPPVGDIRLEDAEQILFGARSFNWIVCIVGVHESSDDWSVSIGERFGYRRTSWRTAGSKTVFLFRRMGEAGTPAPAVCEPRRVIDTRVVGPVKIEAEQWAASLEAFSKWTVDPRWLIYLPPGMCARQTDREDGYLEHPSDAFDYYRLEKIPKVAVELKHMGSRAVAVVCRDAETARRRFGGAGLGCIFSRNGRPFFEDASEILGALCDGLSKAGFWQRFQTDWVCFDGELLPWSLKADRLLEDTHGELLAALEAETHRGSEILRRLAPDESETRQSRSECLRKYRELYEKYRAEKDSPVRFAPFHFVASEGRSYFDKNHVWHMTTLNALARRAGAPFMETQYQLVSLGDADGVARAIAWWEELCAVGSEGVVIKPLYFTPRGRRGLAQPALKCRGKEHLRLVYGPEYDLLENRVRLIDRDALANRRNKHRRVLRQSALSIEAVERFVRHEPLERVRECVRGVISLETRQSSSHSSESASSR